MSLLVYFSDEAKQQIKEAAEWSSSPVFQEELEKTIELISDNPGIGETHSHPTLRGLRRRLLPKTSYYLYYRKDPLRAALQVLCLWNTRRGSPPPL